MDLKDLQTSMKMCKENLKKNKKQNQNILMKYIT